jgi:glycosyltransferase involved in cell wall biosynthesis
VTDIYNGFDPDDFSLPLEDSRTERNKAFRLSYVGTLWNLTSVAPLVGAVQRLFDRRPDFRDCLELSFVGRRTGSQQKLLENLKQAGCRILETPYVEHQQSVDLLRSADALCLLLSDLPGAERVVPAKLFEYLAAHKPILAIAPQGETWDLLKHYPAGSMYAPGDVEGICHWLTTQICRHQEGCPTFINEWDASRFGRDRQAGQLADLLDGLVTSKTRI